MPSMQAVRRRCRLFARGPFSLPPLFASHDPNETTHDPKYTQLRGTEHEPWLRVLEIFAYGTYRTYHGGLLISRARTHVHTTQPSWLTTPTQTISPHTYTENRASLPDLTESHLHKLRQLTLVSMAHQRSVRVPYTADMCLSIP